MPRERVQHGQLFVWPSDREPAPGELPGAGKPYSPGADVLPEGAMLREEPSLDLVWNREAGWVQLGIDAPRDWWERFFASYEGSPEQHHFSAWTNVLSRGEINHLIKSLRRARDAAYGADEQPPDTPPGDRLLRERPGGVLFSAS